MPRHTQNVSVHNQPKCLEWRAENHMLWSVKCSKHSKMLIEIIANTNLISMNRIIREKKELQKKNNRGNSPFSIHNDNKYKQEWAHDQAEKKIFKSV